MKSIFRPVLFLIILSLLVQTTAVLVAPAVAWSAESKITKFAPESAETEPIAGQTARSGSSWWKWALAILVIGGAAAAGGGGGGGSSSSGNSSGVTVTW